MTEPTPGNYEYRETFTWKGEKKEDNLSAIIEGVNEALGPESPIPESSREQFAKAMDNHLNVFFFGPPEPNISFAIASPEFFIRKVRATLGEAMLKDSQRIFGEAMDSGSHRSFVSKMLDPSFASAMANKKTTTVKVGPEAEEETDDQPTTLTMVVKMPGTITETNGLIDPISGEVYWTMHREAVERGEVTIFARSKN